MTNRLRNMRSAAMLAVLTVVLSACGPTFTDLPLPGSDVGGDTKTLKLRFDEALSLGRGAMVKVNGVEAGRVRSVAVKDYKASVTALVKKSVKVREGSSARLRYTTPLGELFVDVTSPSSGAVLANGALLDPDKSSTAPSVEDTLSQASLLVNGGGIGNLATINKELNLAFGGNEDRIRHLARQGNEFVTKANATTGDISRALDALNGFSKVLSERKGTINAALTDLRPAAAVLRENTPALTQLLQQMKKFARMSNQVVGSTRESITKILNMIGPILDEFLASADRIAPSLSALIDLGGKVENVIPADFVNIFLHLKITEAPPDIPASDDPSRVNNMRVGPTTASTTGTPVEYDGNLEKTLNALTAGATTGSTSKLTMSGMTIRGGAQ